MSRSTNRDVLDLVTVLCHRVAQQEPLHAVLVTGSRATGETMDPGADLDIYVVAPRKSSAGLRLAALLRSAMPALNLDITSITPRQLARLPPTPGAITTNLSAIICYGDPHWAKKFPTPHALTSRWVRILVSNRTCELLATWTGSTEKRAAAASKALCDIAIVLMQKQGEFAPTYRERRDWIGARLEQRPADGVLNDLQAAAWQGLLHRTGSGSTALDDLPALAIQSLDTLDHMSEDLGLPSIETGPTSIWGPGALGWARLGRNPRFDKRIVLKAFCRYPAVNPRARCYALAAQLVTHLATGAETLDSLERASYAPLALVLSRPVPSSVAEAIELVSQYYSHDILKR